jgi:hypothetical protein
VGRVRVTAVLRARLGVMAGGAAFASGTGLAWGLAAGLMTAGPLLAAYCLLVMDVDDPGQPEAEADEQPPGEPSFEGEEFRPW